MHPTAQTHSQLFFNTYAQKTLAFVTKPHVLEIGPGTDFTIYNQYNQTFEYTGIDFSLAAPATVLTQDPHKLPFDDNSFDVVVSSSSFEHVEFFWVSFLEIIRVLKPTGLFYLNAPSNGEYHKYPVDCWRFYPDSARALVKWASANGYNIDVLEHFTGFANGSQWRDYVAVFLKDTSYVDRYPNRMVNAITDFENGRIMGSSNFINHVGS
jgi:SAM-dependent methyltransferase